MDVREYLIRWREGKNITRGVAANMCGISAQLLRIVEQGGVTHPNLVKRIQDIYELTDEQAEQLMPENYRKSSPKYEPDKYVIYVPPFARAILPLKSDIMSVYVNERCNRGA